MVDELCIGQYARNMHKPPERVMNALKGQYRRAERRNPPGWLRALKLFDCTCVGELASDWRKWIEQTRAAERLLPPCSRHRLGDSAVSIARLHLGREHLFPIADEK
jgi:hypothetical protein